MCLKITNEAVAWSHSGAGVWSHSEAGVTPESGVTTKSVKAETPHINEFCHTLGQQRPSSSNFNAADKETEQRNPKMRARINDIINENGRYVKQNSSPARQAIPRQNAFRSKKSIVSPRKSSPEVIAKVFPSKPPSHVMDDVFPQAVDSKPRTKEDIIGITDGEDEFIELIRQDGTNRDEYAQLNNMHAESLDEEDDNEEEIESTMDETAESTTTEDETLEGKLKKIIRSTTDYLSEHDKKELLELINEFRKDVGEDFLVDIVQELGELVDVYLLEEFFDGEPIMTKIDELRRKLEVQQLSQNQNSNDFIFF